MKTTALALRELKQRGTPIVALSCYDYPTARLQSAAGVDLIIVGDSVGTNILGHESEREVVLEDIVHHVQAVSRGAGSVYVIGDMPFGTYESPQAALVTARKIIEAGADGIKLEGHRPEQISALCAEGIDVCAHLGLMPQWHEKKSLQARKADDAMDLIRQALNLEDAGAQMIVFELIPEEVAREISKRISIPTIGIGAGRYTDGQVLVTPDMLGLTDQEFRHNRRYADLTTAMTKAFTDYASDVRSGNFPAEEQARHLSDSELQLFEDFLREQDDAG